MTSGKVQTPLREPSRSNQWHAPRVRRLRAGDAEAAGNPAADAPVFS
jgi:hypothetical protein